MKLPFGNQRVSTRKQRKRQHLLDVKVRAVKAREQRNRHLLSWGCMLFLLAGAVGGVYYGVREGMRRFVWENPEYQLKEITVTDDGGSLQREQVVEAAGVRQGVNIFTVNISKMRDALLQMPQIETAEVQRVLPDKIVIAVTERQPVAWVATRQDEDAGAPGGSMLIDARGVLIDCKNQLPSYFHLPVIYGAQTAGLEPGQTLDAPEIKAALDLVRLNSADSAGRFQATAIDVSKGYCLVATGRSHAKITFGLDRLEAQLDRLTTLMDHIESSKREIQTVNLMVQRNIPVTFAGSGAAEDAADDSDAPPAKTEKSPAKPEEPAAKNTGSPSKKSQTAGHKKAVRVKKARAVSDNSEQDRPVRKAIPVNTPDTNSHG